MATPGRARPSFEFTGVTCRAWQSPVSTCRHLQGPAVRPGHRSDGLQFGVRLGQRPQTWRPSHPRPKADRKDAWEHWSRLQGGLIAQEEGLVRLEILGVDGLVVWIVIPVASNTNLAT